MYLTDKDVRNAENAGAIFGIANSALPPSDLHGWRKCRDLSGTNPALVLVELFKGSAIKYRYKKTWLQMFS